MKILLISIKSSLFVLILLATEPLSAVSKFVGKVKAIKGEVFVVSNGETLVLKDKADLYADSQILVSDDSEVSWSDFNDHVFHLTQNSHVNFVGKDSKLIRGSFWVQNMSKSASNIYQCQTMNGIFEINPGEAIITYDPTLNKSQILVITGEATAASAVEPTFKFALSAGQFTFLHPEYEQGMPRTPTKSGYDSLMASMGKFSLAKSMDPGLQNAKRNIASTTETANQEVKKGEIIFVTTKISSEEAVSENKNDEALNYYIKTTQTKKIPKFNRQPASATEEVQVKIWGANTAPKTSVTQRNPAAVIPIKPKVHFQPIQENSDPVTSEFTQSLKNEENNQQIHSNEVQNLIQDLKSF